MLLKAESYLGSPCSENEALFASMRAAREPSANTASGLAELSNGPCAPDQKTRFPGALPGAWPFLTQRFDEGLISRMAQ